MLRGPEWTSICFVLHVLHKGRGCKLGAEGAKENFYKAPKLICTVNYGHFVTPPPSPLLGGTVMTLVGRLQGAGI